MAVIASLVFLAELICVLVPCNPNYPNPDLSGTRGIEERRESVSFKESYSRAEFLKGLFQRFKSIGEDKGNGKREPFVITKGGGVQGYFMKVVGGRDVYAFEGIPYAEAPIGNLRFRSPVPKAPWRGIFPALSPPPPCLQYNILKGFRTLGKEDCLSLSVYTPELPPKDQSKPLLPVIVFIHGGGFFFGGSGVYGPSYLLQRDVVLVIVQYRLGILGFLSSGDSVAPGNWGLKDQRLALSWIHENIASFSGDGNKVTLMGQSAGAAAVHFHMLSPPSWNYFHKAVSISGVAFNYWTIKSKEQARNFTVTLADKMNCPTHNSYEMVECLRNSNIPLMANQIQSFFRFWPYPSNYWTPCIEPIEDNPDPFLTLTPLESYKKDLVAKVPWISTTVSGEGYTLLLWPYFSLQLPTLQKNWVQLAPDLADVEDYKGILDLNKITQKLTSFYLNDKHPKKVPVHNFANIVTDRMFTTGIYKAVQLHSRIAPTYSYIFDVNGQYNMIQSFGHKREEWGVGHVEDLFYVFNSSINYHGFKRTDPEFQVSQLMVNCFTNFASKGEPLLTLDNGTDIYIWEPHESPYKLNFLLIRMFEAFMIPDPFRKRIRFWDKLRIPDTPGEDEVLGLVN